MNAPIGYAVVTALFVLLVFASPSTDKHFLFTTYSGGVNALVTLVSFGVSGIDLSFPLHRDRGKHCLLARLRARRPFILGRGGTVVTWVALIYLV